MRLIGNSIYIYIYIYIYLITFRLEHQFAPPSTTGHFVWHVTTLCCKGNITFYFNCGYSLLWQVRNVVFTYGYIYESHDDVIKWKLFPRYWPFVRGFHRSSVNSPHKGQWRGALMFSMICAWINDWVNNGEAGDLRRYRAHYDVIVMHLFLDHTSLLSQERNWCGYLCVWQKNSKCKQKSVCICDRCICIQYL